MKETEVVSGFRQPVQVGELIELPVYESEAGVKPLVILHELPGMSHSFIRYCQCMAETGFKVYMPLLFKSPGTEMRGLELAKFCISREFRALFATRNRTQARPFTAWLLNLIDYVAIENPDAKIGVVGMCLTGGFSIAAIANPNVNAAILCQPSVPFFTNIETLGLPEIERKNAQDGSRGKPHPCAKGYRYEKDWASRESHMRAAASILGSSLERFPDLPGKGHSTLTGDAASPAVYRDVLEFLNARL